MKRLLLVLSCGFLMACGGAPFTSGGEGTSGSNMDPSLTMGDDAEALMGIETSDGGMARTSPEAGVPLLRDTMADAGKMMLADANMPDAGDVVDSGSGLGPGPGIGPTVDSGSGFITGVCAATTCPVYYKCTMVGLNSHYCDPQ